MTEIETLHAIVQERFANKLQSQKVVLNELTIEVPRAYLREICLALRDEVEFSFDMLLDVAGVDYQDYGITEWTTETATDSGFERGVDPTRTQRATAWNKPRFAVVYHLLSLKHNHRIRIRSFAEGEPPLMDSVVTIWPAANWFEREAFDLFGIIFEGHPDLRRILTDYGFIGHPFRKDFPLIGQVEVRYDEVQRRVVYQPVSIPPRTLVPKVIRRDTHHEASS